MSEQQPANKHYRSAEPDALEDRHAVLREVLRATVQGRRVHEAMNREKYFPVVARFRNSRWEAGTIGCALVEVALESWMSAANPPAPARRQLIEDVAHSLFDDPVASVKLHAWWNALREAAP
jgi:hypothetical protein